MIHCPMKRCPIKVQLGTAMHLFLLPAHEKRWNIVLYSSHGFGGGAGEDCDCKGSAEGFDDGEGGGRGVDSEGDCVGRLDAWV